MDLRLSDKVARTAPGSAAGSPVAVPRAASGALRTQVPLPSPLEVVGGGAPARHSGAPGSAAAKAAAGHGSSNSSKKLTHSAAYPHGPQSAPMLSAQTVTTTTVTTTTVTTYPPLKLPRVEKQRRLSPDMYPLSQMPAPPALEQFALNVGGQRLYFSQRDVENCQSEDVLGSITSNITATEPAGALGSAGAPLPAFPAQNELQRAITPLYTQDDAHHHHQHSLLATPTPNTSSALQTADADVGHQPWPADTSSRFVDPIEYGQQRRHLGGDQMHRYSSPSRESRQPYRNRRSSSPPSPDQHRHFQQRNVYSPSPRAAHVHTHYPQQGRDYSSMRFRHLNTSTSADQLVAGAEGAPTTSSASLAASAVSAAPMIATAPASEHGGTAAGASIGADGTGHPSENSSSNGDDIIALDDPAGGTGGGGVLPLPSPLLSPRARPESMDTDEMSDGSDGHPHSHSAARRRLRFDHDGADMDMSPPASGRHSGSFDSHSGLVRYVGSQDPFCISDETADQSSDEVDEYHGVRRHTSTRTSRTVADSQMSRGMEAMYSLPSIMSTYDNLPASMQTFLLYQLLRRTSRPVLQFASQTILPVLHRDFITDLPVEVSHHILKFMDTRTLCRASCVSNRWQDVVNGNRKVWRARLEDARYVPEAQRIHPLSHTHFGLGKEPPRPITAHKPTRAELDLSSLAERPSNTSAAQKLARAIADDTQSGDHAAWNASASPILTNPFKSEFEHAYRLDRNWQEGRCKHLSFISDAGSVVTCVQLTDDHIIAGFDTKDIYVFDIKTGAVVRQLVGHDGGVWALAVVGSTVISGSTDRTVRVWDLDTGRCTHVFSGHSSTVRCLQVLLPVDVRTPEERARGDPVRYEPSEPYIITGSRDTTLRMWKLPSPTKDAPYITRTGVAARATAAATPAPAAAGPATAAAGTALVEDGMAVDQGSDAPAAAEETAAAEDEETQQQQQQQRGEAAAARAQTDTLRNIRSLRSATTSLAGARTIGTAQSLFSRHMQNLHRAEGPGGALGGSRPFSFLQQQLQQQQQHATAAQVPQADVPLPRVNPYFVRVLEGHTESVRAVAGFGNMVVSGSYDFSIRIWDLQTGQCTHQLEGHTAKVYTLVLDTDLHLIFSGSMDGTIRVWNWDSGACLRILRGHLTLVGLLAMDHNTLVSAGADASLRIWDHPIRPQETPATRQRPFSNIEGDTIDNKSPPLSSFASGGGAAANPLGGAANPLAAPHAIAAAAAIQQAGNIQQMNLLQQLQMQQRANDQLHMQQMANNPEMVPSELLRTERFVLRQHTNAITCFQHDGTKIVSGADNTVKLWDVRTGLFVRDLLSNLSGVWQVRFDKKRCVAAVHRNDVTYFEIMDFDVDVDSSGE